MNIVTCSQIDDCNMQRLQEPIILRAGVRSAKKTAEWLQSTYKEEKSLATLRSAIRRQLISENCQNVSNFVTLLIVSRGLYRLQNYKIWIILWGGWATWLLSFFVPKMQILTSKMNIISDNAARRRFTDSHTAGVVDIRGARTAVDRLTWVLYVDRVRTYFSRRELQSVASTRRAHSRRYDLAVRIYIQQMANKLSFPEHL